MIHFPDEGNNIYGIKNAKEILTKGSQIKITDFGLARILCKNEDFVDSVAGTKYFWSPEIWEQADYNEQSEIWALGIILFQLKHAKTPFVFSP
jgi:serine/threonine protein kinase